jgi:ABC-type spermidine/putrescine transport system permease subunit II
MSGFVGIRLTDTQCKDIFTVSLVLGVLSVGLSNLMVLMRVVALWEHNKVCRFSFSFMPND